MTKIRYVEGVPRWIVRLTHLFYVRRCRKVGHAAFRDLCGDCGQFLPPLSEMDDPNAYMDAQERKLFRQFRDGGGAA